MTAWLRRKRHAAELTENRKPLAYSYLAVEQNTVPGEPGGDPVPQLHARAQAESPPLKRAKLHAVAPAEAQEQADEDLAPASVASVETVPDVTAEESTRTTTAEEPPLQVAAAAQPERPHAEVPAAEEAPVDDSVEPLPLFMWLNAVAERADPESD